MCYIKRGAGSTTVYDTGALRFYIFYHQIPCVLFNFTYI